MKKTTKKAVKKTTAKAAPKAKKEVKLAKEEKAYLIASHYGFEKVAAPSLEKSDDTIAKQIMKQHPDKTEAEKWMLPLSEKVSLTRKYMDGTLSKETQPAIVYYEKFMPNKKSKLIHLEVLGSSKSITEATLMKTAVAILKEYGHDNLSVEINSVGDKDSISKFNKELAAFFRKNINTLSAPLRQSLGKDPFLVISDESEAVKKHLPSAPQVLSFLNDTARAHFKEVLEFLECMNIPYEIVNHLIGHRAYSNNTIFQIVSTDSKEREVLAWGSRHNSLSKKTGFKRDIPSASISILIKKPEKIVPAKHSAENKTKFYFIQVGFDAKLKSLEIIDMLRKAGISVKQSLSKDKMSAQLGSAEAQNFKYLIILGQKEALENTVLVRSVATRGQEAVPVDNLVQYLKKLA